MVRRQRHGETHEGAADGLRHVELAPVVSIASGNQGFVYPHPRQAEEIEIHGDQKVPFPDPPSPGMKAMEARAHTSRERRVSKNIEISSE